jgi:uncharacterized membrane protein (DUF4010 family)
MVNKWIKPGLTLIIVGLLAWYLPKASLDPWNLLSPQKIATMIFALAFIQVISSVLNRFFGKRAGAILTGFFGGLVSSTATTASLARKSKIETAADSNSEMLVFLSATGAMLIEGVGLVWAGTSSSHLQILTTFLGPLLVTVILISIYSRKVTDRTLKAEDLDFKVLPILKLSIFIILILIVSSLLQKFFGQYGLALLTFLVSLFEIHGSFIANVQLHENGAISTGFLSVLIALSIVASYISKIFLIWTLGSQRLRGLAVKSTIYLFLALALSLAISLLVLF